MSIDYTNRKWKNLLIVFFLCLWQLPQFIASLAVMPFVRKSGAPWKNEHTGMTVYRVNHSFSTGWSLGPVIFVNENASEGWLRHESGHSMQSLYLGPLYVFVVAIPSVILYWRRRLQNKSEVWYYLHFPEGWADRLGGVERFNVIAGALSLSFSNKTDSRPLVTGTDTDTQADETGNAAQEQK